MKKTKIGHLGTTNEVKMIQYNGKEITLHRIKALMDFRDIKKGQLGGFVQHIENIQDLAWVGDDAKLYGKAIIQGFSQLSGQAELFDNAQLHGEVDVNGNCKIFGQAHIDGSFIIRDQVTIKDKVSIRGLGRIVGNVTILEDFTAISRLVISGYEEAIEIKGKGSLGSGWYLSESFEQKETKHLSGKIERKTLKSCIHIKDEQEILA